MPSLEFNKTLQEIAFSYDQILNAIDMLAVRPVCRGCGTDILPTIEAARSAIDKFLSTPNPCDSPGMCPRRLW
jgi:hypothetical protein